MSSSSADPGLDRLRLLASAVAGIPVDVAPAARGERSWTDGRTIFLEDGDLPARVRALSVQACLLAAGSLSATRLAALSRRAALARRYLALEGHRALAANQHLLPPAARGLHDPAVAAGLDSSEAALARARGREPVPDLPAAFGTIQARRALAVVEKAESARTRSEPGVAPAATAAPTLPELVDDEPAADDEPTLGNLLTSPVGGGGPIGKLLKRLLSSTRSRDGGGPPGGDAPTHVTRSAGRTGGPGVVSTQAIGELHDEAPGATSGTTYPEWDVRRARYRPAWCTVVESTPPSEAGSTATVVDDLGLHRPLARLGMGLAPQRRQPQGDDIDIDAAVEARVDALAGGGAGTATYVESLRRRRELSVLVLLDVSGSAGEPGIGGRTVHDHQRQVAAALTVALHQLGDRVALYAFNSRGRTSVQLLRVKGFDDHLDAVVARRLDGLVPAAFTRLGAAIRHGAAVLEARGGTPRRLLVVLSDGFAYDHGYEGRYGEADARRALTEARRRGVGCLCLSVGTDADTEALRRVFGAAAHAAVPRTERLGGLIGPLFQGALRSAEAQRRAFQRTERTSERLEIERSTDG